MKNKHTNDTTNTVTHVAGNPYAAFTHVTPETTVTSTFSSYFFLVNDRNVLLQLAFSQIMPSPALDEHHMPYLPALDELLNQMKERGLCAQDDGYPVVVGESINKAIGHFADGDMKMAVTGLDVLTGIAVPCATHITLPLKKNSSAQQLEKLAEFLHSAGLKQRHNPLPQFQSCQVEKRAYEPAPYRNTRSL